MLSAIESPANQRPPFVNCTAALAEIYARSVRSGFQNKDRFSRAALRGSRAVRLNIIALVGVKKKSLAAPAAFDTAIAGHVGFVFGSQLPF